MKKEKLIKKLDTRMEIIVSFLAILDLEESEIENIIKSLLFASLEPLTQNKINNIFNPEASNLKYFVKILNSTYLQDDHAFKIREIAKGFQLVSRKRYEHFIRLLLNKPGMLSLPTASLDCLAIIAYKQPIGRFEVEVIRKVDSSGVIKTLLSLNLVIIKRRDSGLGKAFLYQTTDIFLENFGLIKDLTYQN